jgi:hypothetical protein
VVCTSSDDESDYEDEGAEHSGPQMVIANKNDKGRFSQSPLKQENVGLISQMSREEKERKKADQKLNSAEKILKKTQKDKGPKVAKKPGAGKPSGETRGGAFTDKELRTILQGIYLNKSDRDVVSFFLQSFPTTTRTQQAIKNKSSSCRALLVTQLTKFEESNVITNGLFPQFHIFSTSFFF